jgi:hypothetical protein
LNVVKAWLVSRLLLFHPRENCAPVWRGIPRPKFHTPVFVLTASPPLKKFVPLVSVEVLLRLAKKKGS